MPHRICITGCAGTGKTTLATHLSQVLALPLLPENFDQVAWQDLHTDRRHFVASCITWIQHWHQVTDGHHANGWVSDRGANDLLTTLVGEVLLTEAYAQQLLQHCAILYRRVDLVVCTSYRDALDLCQPATSNERSLERNLKPEFLIARHSLHLGLLHQCLPAHKVFVLPPQLTTEQRTMEILRRLGHHTAV